MLFSVAGRPAGWSRRPSPRTSVPVFSRLFNTAITWSGALSASSSTRMCPSRAALTSTESSCLTSFSSTEVLTVRDSTVVSLKEAGPAKTNGHSPMELKILPGSVYHVHETIGYLILADTLVPNEQ